MTETKTDEQLNIKIGGLIDRGLIKAGSSTEEIVDSFLNLEKTISEKDAEIKDLKERIIQLQKLVEGMHD